MEYTGKPEKWEQPDKKKICFLAAPECHPLNGLGDPANEIRETLCDSKLKSTVPGAEKSSLNRREN
jgi:hypothetical protein